LLTHDHFEQLCGAAVTGQITRHELLDLQEHMETCANCREFVGDVGEVIGPAILECADKRFPVKLPKGVAARFIAMAHSEGIPLGKKRPSGVESSNWQKGIVLVATLAIVLLLSLLILSKLMTDVQRHPDRTSRVIQPSSIPTRRDEASELLNENAKLKEILAASSLKLASSQQKVKAAEGLTAEIRSRLNDVEKLNADSLKTLDTRDAQIAQLKTDLDLQMATKQADDIAFQTEEAELRSLRDNKEKLSEELRRVQALAASAKDAKDLMAARNLHVVDVNDVNENGKKQRPFGRVYYAEGKTLRFYAYDLSDPGKVDAKVQFYVWGEKHGVTVKTLGVLHSDSLADNRWRLDFDDAHVLAQIDTVFVTVESEPTPAVRPTGKRILDAVLGNRPNHP
jgi:hypothetical protein